MPRNTSIYITFVFVFVMAACNANVSAPTAPPAQASELPMTDAPTEVLPQVVATQTVAALPTQTAITSEGYYPLDIEECQSIRDKARSALKVRFSLINAPFADFGLQGEACVIEAFGSGAEFNMDSTPKALESVFSDWTPNMQFAADGPTGKVVGFTKDSAILLITVKWEPSAYAGCPSDQPISACPLTPWQKLFTITLKAAKK